MCWYTSHWEDIRRFCQYISNLLQYLDEAQVPQFVSIPPFDYLHCNERGLWMTDCLQLYIVIILTDTDISTFNGQTRLNHLGILLSSQRRLCFQESTEETAKKMIIDQLKTNPLIKITGDNLDIYVKTSNLTSERRNKDLNLFTSNLIFSQITTVDMSTDAPKTDVSKLSADHVLLHVLGTDTFQKGRLCDAFLILLARVLCSLPPFLQYSNLFPSHIPHEYTKKMSKRSTVVPLPIMLKNEAKHEDCLAIMDSYEDQLTKLFNGAFGNTDTLRKYKVVVGGDQLTRVRLKEAKNLRTLSITPEKRFEDLYPIVCEMWHSKQDLLEKCYKTFYKTSTETTPGTLPYFKTILHRTNVNRKVKGRFQPHMDLLLAVGEGLIKEQFMEFFKMDNRSSAPIHHLLEDISNQSSEEKLATLKIILEQFMQKYGYGCIDKPDEIPYMQKEMQFMQKYRFVQNGQEIFIQPFYETVVSTTQDDELFNYSMQLCHWVLLIMNLNDTAKEGDITRAMLNSKYSIPFFFSHSRLSKYLVENIDHILKAEYLLSSLQRIRMLEGSFTNIRGGIGNNVESDLVQEHSV